MKKCMCCGNVAGIADVICPECQSTELELQEEFAPKEVKKEE